MEQARTSRNESAGRFSSRKTSGLNDLVDLSISSTPLNGSDPKKSLFSFNFHPKRGRKSEPLENKEVTVLTRNRKHRQSENDALNKKGSRPITKKAASPSSSYSLKKISKKSDKNKDKLEEGRKSETLENKEVTVLTRNRKQKQSENDTLNNSSVVLTITKEEKSPSYSRKKVSIKSPDKNKDKLEKMVILHIDRSEKDYSMLANSADTGNIIGIEESDLKSCATVVKPGELNEEEVFDGIHNGMFFREGNTTSGYLRISPKTVKPFEMTGENSFIYWILKGEIIIRSTAFCKVGAHNFLYGETLGVGCCITVPHNTGHTIENRTIEEALIGFTLITNKDLQPERGDENKENNLTKEADKEEDVDDAENI